MNPDDHDARRLESIPVTVVAPDSGLSGNAWPLMLEIAALVQQLLETGESAAIDLSALPLTPADKNWLKTRLGEGQIHATLEAEGRSTLEETACSGVWWVTHRNPQDQVQSEFIEVTWVPDLIRAQPDDVKMGHEYLNGIISELS